MVFLTCELSFENQQNSIIGRGRGTRGGVHDHGQNATKTSNGLMQCIPEA